MKGVTAFCIGAGLSSILIVLCFAQFSEKHNTEQKISNKKEALVTIRFTWLTKSNKNKLL
jgi:hypothetical protein